MKLTKQQRQKRDQAIRQAVAAAIKSHFTGYGASGRIAAFLRNGLSRSAAWILAITCYLCGAAVLGLTVGPSHEALLAEFHAWMVTTPLDVVIATSNRWAFDFGMQFVAMGLLGGFLHALFALVNPSSIEARERFYASIA